MACAANSFPPPGTELRRSCWEWRGIQEREVEKAFKSIWAVSLPNRIGEHEGNAKTGNRFRYRARGAKDIARSFPSPGTELRRRSGGKLGGNGGQLAVWDKMIGGTLGQFDL